MSLKCGLLGEKLSHSQSPRIHAALGQYEYKLYEKTPAEAEEFLLHGDYDVINVTIPYKKTAFGLCSAVSSAAAQLGNVNVVIKRFDGTLFGDNTDAAGFAKLIEILSVDISGKKCVILGTGGAAMTASVVLGRLGAGAVVHISRSGPDNYSNIRLHSDAKILINATPVGMFPDVDSSPVDLSLFPETEAVIDLIYNPSPTKLLAEATARGIPNIGGMPMLEEQARLASVHMNANLYLYGAPGSGKTTYARRLAAEKDMPLADLDAEIVRTEGRSVSEIFARDGEAAFRALEKSMLERISKGRGQIVALGGGSLLDPECRKIAEATGRVIFLECPDDVLLERIKGSSERPLLADDTENRLRRLLDARRSHYESFRERINPCQWRKSGYDQSTLVPSKKDAVP